MNKSFNTFLLNGERFISKLHLSQPRNNDTTHRPFTKHLERIKKFRDIDYLKHIYRNELDINLALLMMQINLMVKIWLGKLFQTRFER